MNYKLLTIITLLITSIATSAQDLKRETVYITPDSLSYIHLFPNNNFGYIRFEGKSPLMYYSKKKKTIGFSCGPSFEFNQYGSGKYSIIDDKIKLEFIKPKHSVDSIYTMKSQKQSDSIAVKIKFVSYIYLKETGAASIGNRIVSEDSSININTGFDNFAEFKINRKHIPLKLMVNDKYELEIKSENDHDITLFINDFKFFYVMDSDEPITLDFNTLIKNSY